MKVALFIILILTLSLSAWANSEVNIADRIASEQFYKGVYPTLFGEKRYAHPPTFKKSVEQLEPKSRKKVMKLVQALDKTFPMKVLMPLIHWRLIDPDSTKNTDVLAYYLLYKLMIIRDQIDHPQNGPEKRSAALALLRDLTGTKADSNNFFGRLLPNLVSISSQIALISSDEKFISAIKSEPLFTRSLPKHYPDYLLSFAGFIPGNKVELVSFNDRSNERIKWYNDRVIFAGGTPFPSDAPYLTMPLPGQSDVGHIAFQTDDVFKRIRDMILRAEDSIFIDIFLFGGTLGGTIAKFLVDQTLLKAKKNPNFKTMLLHDYATNYNMKPEMMPIFEYLRNRINSEPMVKKHLMLLQANIQRHPPGMPFGITNLIPKTPETFKAIEQRNTYFESKIDHSKVLIIDGNTDHPQAYFGSKNWSDHSGGYYYDDIIFVEGPAAAMVQASYLDDVAAALTTDKAERAWFFFKEDGFGNDHYLENREAILEWMKIKKTHYPRLGDQSVRLAEANVDGQIKNVRNILVDMIKNANKSIYMEELFIYDSYVVDALIKRKIELGDQLEIKILADHNGNFGMNGLPNTLYLKEMKDHGIELRARRTVGIHTTFPDGSEKEYHQENHRKICSIDGEVMLGGSSNINPDTLQGSFREFGAQLFSKEVIGKFEQRFLTAWKDEGQTMELDVENVQLQIGKLKLSITMSEILNGLGGTIYRAKDGLEARY
jgi:phosphatidylserine/phosphatidylglycerophosphate/cardiolipin synthase-like enzyme